jgi:hypothetical protein
MERLTKYVAGVAHGAEGRTAESLTGSYCRGEFEATAIVDRLAAYEDTGLEPDEITRILDAYGRGMTLRTENAQRLEIVKGIQTDRLRELVQADKENRVLPEGCGWFVTCSGKKLTVVMDIEAALRREQE